MPNELHALVESRKCHAPPTIVSRKGHGIRQSIRFLVPYIKEARTHA